MDTENDYRTLSSTSNFDFLTDKKTIFEVLKKLVEFLDFSFAKDGIEICYVDSDNAKNLDKNEECFSIYILMNSFDNTWVFFWKGKKDIEIFTTKCFYSVYLLPNDFFFKPNFDVIKRKTNVNKVIIVDPEVFASIEREIEKRKNNLHFLAMRVKK
jgi:hypothetical protein